MSTRSYIGIVNKDGTVRAIYHHFDGYLSYLGRMLTTHYQTEERVNKLLDLGDISSIGTEPVGTWDEERTRDRSKCYTYRERGETGVDARTYKSIDEFLDYCREDYTYLFNDGEWLYREWGDTNLRLVKEDLK